MVRSCLAFLLLLALWEIVCLAGVLPSALLPSPPEAAAAFRELLSVGMPPGRLLAGHALHSLARVLAGVGLAVLLGVPVGLALGASGTFRSFFLPLINFFRPIPPLAWIPLAILWFGLGFFSSVYLIFLGAFFPIALAACSGVRGVDRLYLDSLRVLRATRRDIWLKALLPGAMPSIVTGVRVGLGVGWMTLVAAEFAGTRGGYGLGYMIMTARDLQRIDEVVAGMAAIGLIGLGLEFILERAARRLLRWM
ncbi:MAG: ABC transporter permease [Desulfovibrio sp.]|jgi:ABC-type nitrate/sulfonate/bicarbonate transport system permease component|nr:ABC transporter permease [Desulfovibrio sp.]